MTHPFQVIIDCPFKEITKDATLTPIDNKYSVCVVNDFEDGSWYLEAFHVIPVYSLSKSFSASLALNFK